MTIKVYNVNESWYNMKKRSKETSTLVSRFKELLWLKQAADKRKYSNQDIVDALGEGFSISTVMRLKSGKGFETMPLYKVQRVADWLGVNLNELIEHQKEIA